VASELVSQPQGGGGEQLVWQELAQLLPQELPAPTSTLTSTLTSVVVSVVVSQLHGGVLSQLVSQGGGVLSQLVWQGGGLLPQLLVQELLTSAETFTSTLTPVSLPHPVLQGGGAHCVSHGLLQFEAQPPPVSVSTATVAVTLASTSAMTCAQLTTNALTSVATAASSEAVRSRLTDTGKFRVMHKSTHPGAELLLFMWFVKSSPCRLTPLLPVNE